MIQCVELTFNWVGDEADPDSCLSEKSATPITVEFRDAAEVHSARGGRGRTVREHRGSADRQRSRQTAMTAVAGSCVHGLYRLPQDVYAGVQENYPPKAPRRLAT